jgi:hypothetical protein
MITIRTGMTIRGTSQEPISSTFLMPGGSYDSRMQPSQPSASDGKIGLIDLDQRPRFDQRRRKTRETTRVF